MTPCRITTACYFMICCIPFATTQKLDPLHHGTSEATPRDITSCQPTPDYITLHQSTLRYIAPSYCYTALLHHITLYIITLHAYTATNHNTEQITSHCVTMLYYMAERQTSSHYITSHRRTSHPRATTHPIASDYIAVPRRHYTASHYTEHYPIAPHNIRLRHLT